MYKHKNTNKLNIILADTRLETFKELSEINKEYNFINLNSDFAVNFVMEYEEVDLIIISKNIGNLEEINRKANSKNILLYQIGKDLKYPLDIKEIRKVLTRELKKKLEKQETNKLKISDFFSIFKYKSNNRSRLEKHKIDKSQNEKNRKLQKPTSKNIKNEKEIREYKTIKQKIIVFVKAKGGVGSTLLSIYLGYCLRNLKTILIDLNFAEGGGDVSYYLDIPKYPNIVNFISGYNDKKIKESAINFINKFDILQAPPTIELSKLIDLQDIYNLVDIIKKKYDIVIFDLPNILNDFYFGVTDLADIMIMISDGTIGSIGRLSKINKEFNYSDLQKILIFNKQLHGKNIDIKAYQNIFSTKDIINIDKVDSLNEKSDYSKFDFGSLKEFKEFKNKVMQLLTVEQVGN